MKRLFFWSSSVIVIIFLFWISSIFENKLKQTFIVNWIIKDGFQLVIIRTLLIVLAVVFFIRWLKNKN